MDEKAKEQALQAARMSLAVCESIDAFLFRCGKNDHRVSESTIDLRNKIVEFEKKED